MINILIYLYLFTWIYIIYFNLFIKTTNFYILYDSDNNEYAIINIYNILDSDLILKLYEKMNQLNYFYDDKYIGLNYLYVKEILLAIPLDKLYITSNNLISFSNTINIKNNKKKKIQDKIINFNNIDNLLMKNIYNYEINNIIIPFYLIINN